VKKQQPEIIATDEYGNSFVLSRVNRLPKWARDYIMNIETFIGAPEVQELTFLRDQNKALIKLVGELKAENRRLLRRLKKQA